MSWEEFERMPWRFGWKHEYWDGCAHLTPRAESAVTACVTQRAVEAADAEDLIECFIETFQEGVEFCDWQAEQFQAHARRNITGYFAGRRGAPHEVSRLATSNEAETGAIQTSTVSAQRIIAAALFIQKPDAPVLDLLMVRPGFRRRGIARALIIAAMNDLHARGFENLRSAYVVSNEESAAWHRAFGFSEEPGLHLARLRREFFRHEMWRYETLSGVDARNTYARLKAECEFWQGRVDELEAICESEGYESVTPVLRYN